MSADAPPAPRTPRRLAVWLVAALMAAGGFALWQKLKPQGLPTGIASGNGRIEATDIDVATRTPGRLQEVRVKEGEDVQAGQVLAVMDRSTLEADLQRAQAQLRQAQDGKHTAAALLAQREQAVQTAQAVVTQRQAELKLASRQLQRTQDLVNKGFLSPQKLDEAQAQLASAQAGQSAAESMVAEARTAVTATRSQLVEADSVIASAQASVARVQADLDDTALKAPRAGRVQVLAAHAGEVLGAGGRVVSLVDVGDVYMNFFLPETVAGRLAIGAEVRLVLDAAPQYVIPAKVAFVASVAQFTPKTVETTAERQKLVFKVKAQIDRALLEQYRQQVKTGMPGMAYVRVQPDTAWPEKLNVALPAQTYPASTASAGSAP